MKHDSVCFKIIEDNTWKGNFIFFVLPFMWVLSAERPVNGYHWNDVLSLFRSCAFDRIEINFTESSRIIIKMQEFISADKKEMKKNTPELLTFGETLELDECNKALMTFFEVNFFLNAKTNWRKSIRNSVENGHDWKWRMQVQWTFLSTVWVFRFVIRWFHFVSLSHWTRKKIVDILLGGVRCSFVWCFFLCSFYFLVCSLVFRRVHCSRNMTCTISVSLVNDCWLPEWLWANWKKNELINSIATYSFERDRNSINSFHLLSAMSIFVNLFE